MASPKASSTLAPPKQPSYVPSLVYLLHREAGPSSSGFGKILGIFSTLDLAISYVERRTTTDPHIYNANHRAYITADGGRFEILPRTHDVSVKAGDTIFVAVQARAHWTLSAVPYPSEEDAWSMCQQYKKSCVRDVNRYYVEEKEWVDEKGRRIMEAVLHSNRDAPRKCLWCVEACKVDCLVGEEMGEDKREEMEVD